MSDARQMAEDAQKRDLALYQPYINFRNPTWLKEAVLYWDRIYRIAPHGYEAFDPPQYWTGQGDDLRRLEGEAVVERCEVDLAGEIAPLTDLWRAFVAKYGDELAKYYALSDTTHPMEEEDDGVGKGYVPTPGPHRRGVGWLLGSKMDPILVNELLRLKLAVAHHDGGYAVWYGFDVQLLDAYMTTLTNAVIAEQPVQTITDTAGHFRRFAENSMEALRETLLVPHRPAKKDRGEAPGGPMIMNLAIQTVCPAGLASLSFQEVLAIRGQTLGPREEFKAAMKGAEADLRVLCEGPGGHTLVETELAAVQQKHITKPLGELRKAMRSSLGDAVWSVITLKSPLEAGTVGAAALMAAHASSPVITGIGIALGFVPIVRAYAAQRAAAAKSPLAWLLDVERKLGARETIEAVVASPLRPPG